MARSDDGFGPAPTTHARLRWTQRSASADQSLRRAWETGETIGAYAHGDLDADEVRYHERTETVIIKRAEHLTTVLDAQLIEGPPRKAIERLRDGDST